MATASQRTTESEMPLKVNAILWALLLDPIGDQTYELIYEHTLLFNLLINQDFKSMLSRRMLGASVHAQYA